jgi:hypothetical protein
VGSLGGEIWCEAQNISSLGLRLAVPLPKEKIARGKNVVVMLKDKTVKMKGKVVYVDPKEESLCHVVISFKTNKGLDQYLKLLKNI